MTIKEAEAVFKRFDGFFFHMGREEPEQYSAYKELKINKETEEQWRQELIDDYFEHLFDKPNKVCYVFSSIIAIIYNTETLRKENCVRLISMMEKMISLDKKNKILIIETMTGSRGWIENGACALICKSTSAEERKRMNEAVMKLADFTCTEEDNEAGIAFNNMKKRHMEAVQTYKKRYEIYKDGTAPFMYKI